MQVYSHPSPVIRAARITTIPGTLLNFIRGQAGFWRESGFDWFYVSSPEEDLDQVAERDQVKTYPVRMPRRVTPLADLVALARLTRILRTERPELLHTHTPKAGLLGQLAGRLAGVPVRVHTIHGLPYVEVHGVVRLLLKWSDRVACHSATSVTFVAPWLAERVVADRVCPPERVGLIQRSLTGVDSSVFRPSEEARRRAAELRGEWGIPATAPVVGFVGRLVRHKGLNDLAAAWPLVLDALPSAHLVLIGDWESEDPVTRETRSYFESEKSVHLIGSTAEIVPWYAALDVLTLPSYREGLPKVLVEASSLGVPVVATDIPDCQVGMVDCVTGVTVPPRDPPALAGSLLALLNDPDARRRLGAGGQAWASENFRPRDRWEEMASLYRRLLAEKHLLSGNGQG